MDTAAVRASGGVANKEEREFNAVFDFVVDAIWAVFPPLRANVREKEGKHQGIKF
jgi:hypothetical protein